jgi:2-polyprenyl-3-methyl-5-hydroxy-6-metoxy-1,4-benzoquinol methylase
MVSTLRNFDAYTYMYRSMPFERIQETYRREHVADLLRDLQAERALEVGCGLKSIFTEWLPSVDAVIVEPISDHLDAATALLGQRGTVTSWLGTFEDYAQTCAPGVFDVVLMSSVLHETTDPALTLAATHHVLSDGHLVLVTNNPRSIHRLIGCDLGWAAFDERTHTEQKMQQLPAWSQGQLKTMLTAAGFDVVHQYTIFPKLLTHQQMQDALDAGLIDESWVAGMNALGSFLPEHGSEIITIARKS